MDKPEPTVNLDRPSILIGILLATILLWLAHPRPYIGSDSGGYLDLAHQVAVGKFPSGQNPGHVFSHRLGMYTPVALLFRLFGVNAWSTYLWPLLCSVLAATLIWFAAPPGNARPFSALFWSLSLLQHRYTTCLFPDLVVSTFMLTSAFLLYRRPIQPEARSRQVLYGTLSVLALFFAFLTKETAYWVLPVWIWVLISDVMGRRMRQVLPFYLSAAMAAVLLLTVYLLFTATVWGDPLARFRALQQVAGEHLWSWNRQSDAHLISRITTEPIGCFLTMAMPAAAIATTALLTTPLFENRFWKVYLLVVVVLWWFGTTSFSTYAPLPLTARMTLPLLPPICVLAGSFLARIPRCSALTFSCLAPIVIGLILISAMPWIATLSAKSSAVPRWVYLIFILLYAGYGALAIFGMKVLLRVAMPILVLGMTSAQLLFTSKEEGFDSQIAEANAVMAIRSALEQSSGRTLVLTSESRSTKAFEYYFGYQYPKGLTVHRFDERFYSAYGGSPDQVFFYINQGRARFLKKYYKNQTPVEKMRKIIGESDAQTLFKSKGIEVVRIGKRK